MTYGEALERLKEYEKLGSRLGLDGIRALLRLLDNPQDKIKTVHVAGTNGKGSVIAFLESVGIAANEKTGAYTSPALNDMRENIRVCGEPISKKTAAKLLEEVLAAADEALKSTGRPITRFEIETALAYLYFYRSNCSLNLIETGLGGRDDATNIISSPALCIITPIALEHTSILGGGIRDIAAIKAGIIKPGAVVISAGQEESVTEIIKSAAKNNRLVFVSALEPLNGIGLERFPHYQIQNIALAVKAAEELGLPEEAIRRGIEKTKWFGRFGTLSKDPFIIVDGAHNPNGVEALTDSLSRIYKNEKFVFVVGIFKDKDADSMLKIAAPYAEKFILIQQEGNERLFCSKELKEIACRYNGDVFAASSVEEGIKTAVKFKSDKKPIVCFGSLSTIKAIDDAVEGIKNDR